VWNVFTLSVHNPLFILLFITCAGLLTITYMPFQHYISVKPVPLHLCDKEHNLVTPLQGKGKNGNKSKAIQVLFCSWSHWIFYCSLGCHAGLFYGWSTLQSGSVFVSDIIQKKLGRFYTLTVQRVFTLLINSNRSIIEVFDLNHICLKSRTNYGLWLVYSVKDFIVTVIKN
jgi:hypothetical protein